ncbi:hypothetical protein CHARACLAT_005926 [Characodon lateralis]|uniref:Uncharacterized protein n=1 Tax=Characodon lateralis TaxID=208331 RepID=A0ABU7CKT5_9TELE|nr:hypothetical protein [Characodon lateralis]
MAQGCLQLDAPPAKSAPLSAFFRHRDAETAFVVLSSAEYVQELHACWTDTRTYSRPMVNGRALAGMHEVPSLGWAACPLSNLPLPLLLFLLMRRRGPLSTTAMSCHGQFTL